MPSRSQRREKILEAAGNAFLANGYSDVTMHDVAKEAQISRAALYTYFGSKQKVFSGAIEFFLSVVVLTPLSGSEKARPSTTSFSPSWTHCSVCGSV